jgi:putative Mg2+ transporter-C (MgtC) family protein
MARMWDDPLFRLLLASLLGGVIGWERFVDHKPAGLRTHTLVCLGSAAFVLASEQLLRDSGANIADVTRVVQGVVTGIGFIGAGTILQTRDGTVRGLTTAATIWLVSGIGVAVGLGDLKIGIVSTLISIVVLRGFRRIEEAWDRGHGREPREDENFD